MAHVDFCLARSPVPHVQLRVQTRLARAKTISKDAFKHAIGSKDADGNPIPYVELRNFRSSLLVHYKDEEKLTEEEITNMVEAPREDDPRVCAALERLRANPDAVEALAQAHLNRHGSPPSDEQLHGALRQKARKEVMLDECYLVGLPSELIEKAVCGKIDVHIIRRSSCRRAGRRSVEIPLEGLEAVRASRKTYSKQNEYRALPLGDSSKFNRFGAFGFLRFEKGWRPCLFVVPWELERLALETQIRVTHQVVPAMEYNNLYPFEKLP